MSLIAKLFSAVKGLFLTASYTKKFDMDMFTGKRIAIIGAANSAYNTNRGSFIDSFDFVVRVNKAPLLLKEGKGAKDIGTKLDVLFHSFFENDYSGGGPLDFALYDKLGVRYVINPIPTYFGYRVTFNFYKKYLLKRKVYTLDAAPYKEMIKAFGRYRPTTGFCALHAVLESNFGELFITGFTFFKTAYADGYRDPMKEAAQAKQYIKDSNIHNPDIEYEEFKKLLKKNSFKKIEMDETLKQILQNDPSYQGVLK